MSIRINETLKSTECDLWREEEGKKQEYIGHIKNEVQFHDVRVQIMKEKAKGYFFYWKGHMLAVDSDGRLAVWPTGFYDQIQNLMLELL